MQTIAIECACINCGGVFCVPINELISYPKINSLEYSNHVSKLLEFYVCSCTFLFSHSFNVHHNKVCDITRGQFLDHSYKLLASLMISLNSNVFLGITCIIQIIIGQKGLNSQHIYNNTNMHQF